MRALNALARRFIVSRRNARSISIVLFLGAAFCIYRATRTEQRSEYVVFRSFSKPSPVPFGTTQVSMVSLEFVFTNPTAHSIWFVPYPGMQSNPFTWATELTPSFQISSKKSFREHWAQKVSGFPSNLKPPWGLWSVPLPPLAHLTNEPVQELQPRESLRVSFGASPGRTMRVGVVCVEKPAKEEKSFHIYWSAAVTPPLP